MSIVDVLTQQTSHDLVHLVALIEAILLQTGQGTSRNLELRPKSSGKSMKKHVKACF